MEKTKKRILFFTPYATRTGSEMMLLYILQNIDRTRFDVGLVSFANGELLQEFPKDIPRYLAPKKFNFFQKVQFHLGVNPTIQSLRKLARDFKADLWYVNTMMLPETAIVAKEFSIRLITHFHELPLTYNYLGAKDLKGIIDNSDLIIGCSKVTCDVIRHAGAKNVSLLYSFIDSGKIRYNQERTEALRKKFNIGKEDYVWVLSGMTSERKGFDFLPEIAELIDNPTVHLIWVGDTIDDGLVYYTEQRCHNTTAKTHIHIVGKQKEDYYNYLNLGNGFVLTSRQDPFPLVMIEAAMLGKPIVSFPSGGVAEFVREGMGFVTEDISVRQIVAAMTRIMNNEIPLNSVTSIERAREFSIERGYQNWIEIIEKIQ